MKRISTKVEETEKSGEDEDHLSLEEFRNTFFLISKVSTEDVTEWILGDLSDRGFQIPNINELIRKLERRK